MNSTAEHITRPFHFMVAFWGERYRDYFVDLFLPSMLAPNNLPLLRAEEGHRFYIATPWEDWQAIETLPIMQRLSLHARPRWVEVSPRPEEEGIDDEYARYVAVLRHMNICLRAVLEAAYDRCAYGSFHLPDFIVSDGMVESLLRSARAGYRLVLCPALRQTEEAVLAELEDRGLWSARPRASATGNQLTIPPGVAAGLAARHLHREMAMFEEGAEGQPSLPPFRFWRMPEGRGIVLQTLFVVPVLMDYAIVSGDHTRCLDDEHFENVYVSANFRNCPVHVVHDSDEFMILSITPHAIDHSMRVPSGQLRSALRQSYDRLCDMRRSYEFYVLRKGDLTRHTLFQIPVRWHVEPIDEAWRQAEHRIERLIARAVGDYYPLSSIGEPGEFGRYRLTWRTLLLDVPWLDLPSRLRGSIMAFLSHFPALRRAVMRLKDKRA
jgi:hypothetical protein